LGFGSTIDYTCIRQQRVVNYRAAGVGLPYGVALCAKSVCRKSYSIEPLTGQTLAEPGRSSPHYRKYNRHIFDVLRVIFCH
jgi:hypothetical protein